MSQQFSPSRKITHQQQNAHSFYNTMVGMVDFRPKYQREIRWNHAQMNALVLSVINGDLIPECVLWQNPDPEAKCCYEVIDGQHRCFALINYFAGKYVTLKNKTDLIYIPYIRDGKDIRIFYTKTEDTTDFADKNPTIPVEYLTEANRRKFSTYLWSIQVIESPMEEHERQSLFLKLQQGIPVRGSDLFKNYMDVPLIRDLYSIDAETTLGKPLLSFLTVEPTQFWLQWIVRFVCMIHDSTNFNFSDSEINTQMKRNTLPDVLHASIGDDTVHSMTTRIFAFMHTFVAKHGTLTPCQFYAMADVIKTTPIGWEDSVIDHIGDWAKKQKDKISMRPKDIQARVDTFDRYKKELDIYKQEQELQEEAIL